MFYNGFEYNIIENKVIITGFDDSSITHIEIPNEIDGYPVTMIWKNCFNGYRYLKSVIIPDSVTRIGPSAFCGCHSLETINIPDYVTEIGAGTFYNCSLLKSINIPNSVNRIGGNCFYDCRFLTKINSKKYNRAFSLINNKIIESYDWFYNIKYQIGDDYCTNYSIQGGINYFIDGKKYKF